MSFPGKGPRLWPVTFCQVAHGLLLHLALSHAAAGSLLSLDLEPKGYMTTSVGRGPWKAPSQTSEDLRRHGFSWESGPGHSATKRTGSRLAPALDSRQSL